MVTTTYLLLVALVGLIVWRYLARSGRSGDTAGTPGSRRRLRALLVGADGDDDLVERMAAELARHTKVFGSSHAVPGHIGAELPVGVFEAATAARAQLTHEVLQRYCVLMDERCCRAGRASFALPERYALHVALACGPEERVTASFAPIVDVRAATGGPTAPVAPVVRALPIDEGPATRRRGGDEEVTVGRLGPRHAEGHEVVLEVDGACCAEGRLGEQAPSLLVGRGGDVALRCPETVEDVSRRHARLLWRDGRCWVSDEHSVNGTWLGRPDGQVVPLVPGEPTPWSPGEVLLLDEERTARVTLR